MIAMTSPMAEIDPNTVRPGWVALLIVLALGAATVLLWRNMGKQLKKIDFDPDAGAHAPPEPADPSAAATPAVVPDTTDTTDTTGATGATGTAGATGTGGTAGDVPPGQVRPPG